MDLTGYHFTLEVPVAWGDMDAFGHVNNVLFLRYFESARVEYFRRLGYISRQTTDDEGPIVANLTCNYRRPTHYPDTLTVAVRTLPPKTTSFLMEFKMFSRSLGGELVADGSAVIVHYSYKHGQKAPVPDELRQLIAKAEHWEG